MREILNFALENPGLLLVPAAGFTTSLALAHVKKRYVHDGVILGHPIEKPTHASLDGEDSNEETHHSSGIDPKVWILALDGFLTRYQGLPAAMRHRGLDEKTNQFLRCAAEDWYLLRHSIDARSAKHLASELQRLDSISERMLNREARNWHLAYGPAVFPNFMAEIHALRQEACAGYDKPNAPGT